MVGTAAAHTEDRAFDLVQVVRVISDALDLVGIDDLFHGKRVAYMADVVAQAAGWSAELRADLFLGALLHDLGVSCTGERRCLIGTLHWEGAEGHCLRGARHLEHFRPLAHLAPAVRHHHTAWSLLDAVRPRLAPRDRDLAACLHLADRADALIQRHGKEDVLLAAEPTRAALAEERGSRFDPVLVDAFLHASQAEAFWFTLEPTSLLGWVADRTRRALPCRLDIADLRALALILADVVDAKSPFTAEHSRGVARVARSLGALAGVDGRHLELLEVAALLHDLGKLRVPDEVLEKPGKLDPAERATMLRHSFHTWDILHRIGGLEEVASWAAFHHEELSGTGYPFHLRTRDLGLEPRVIAVADVYQALAQDRPYRGPLSPETILGMLWGMAERRKLDPDLVGLVESHIEEIDKAARGAVAYSGIGSS